MLVSVSAVQLMNLHDDLISLAALIAKLNSSRLPFSEKVQIGICDPFLFALFREYVSFVGCSIPKFSRAFSLSRVLWVLGLILAAIYGEFTASLRGPCGVVGGTNGSGNWRFAFSERLLS